MENSEFAKIFWEISELLELKNENRFKVRAYQKAAQNIENLSDNLADIYKINGLEGLMNIPGIGEHIAGKIEELIKTGKQKLHQQLLKEFPRGFIEMIQVPGIGPKTALLLNKKFKIDSIVKLKKAVEKGLIKNLPGFKEKKIENIRKGLELKARVKGRFLLSEADQYINSIVEQLKALKEVDQVLPSGSYRRGKETVGDIDILVINEYNFMRYIRAEEFIYMRGGSILNIKKISNIIVAQDEEMHHIVLDNTYYPAGGARPNSAINGGRIKVRLTAKTHSPIQMDFPQPMRI